VGTGIDFDANATESGHKKYGLDLIAGDFQTADFDSGGFDAVTLSHVIEHVPDPVACLDKCRQILKPGGRVVLLTPNFLSLGHHRFGRDWRGLEPPRHLHIFSPDALAECARRAGLTVVRSGSTAVNADYLAKTSLAIRRSSNGATGTAAATRLGYVLAAAAFQYREHFALRSYLRHPHRSSNIEALEGWNAPRALVRSILDFRCWCAGAMVEFSDAGNSAHQRR
jgi:SAM-dependent methyltransferase